jgi:hypothetical protein
LQQRVARYVGFGGHRHFMTLLNEALLRVTRKSSMRYISSRRDTMRTGPKYPSPGGRESILLADDARASFRDAGSGVTTATD